MSTARIKLASFAPAIVEVIEGLEQRLAAYEERHETQVQAAVASRDARDLRIAALAQRVEALETHAHQHLNTSSASITFDPPDVDEDAFPNAAQLDFMRREVHALVDAASKARWVLRNVVANHELRARAAQAVDAALEPFEKGTPT